MKIPENVMNNLEYLLPELNPVDKGKYYLANCPSCGKKELYIYKNKDFLVCNRLNKCGYVNSIINYLKDERALSSAQIMKLIVQANNELSYDETIENKKIELSKIKLPENIKYFSDNENSFYYKKAKKYLLNRGIPENNIDDLGYIIKDDLKIFFPFYEGDEIVYYTFRTTDKNSYMRWLDPIGFDKHQYVYNIDKMKENSNVFIFEGLMDALSLEKQIGTATMTSKLGRMQILKILNTLPKNIILVPDIDKAGLLSLNKNIELIKEYVPPSLNINIYVYIIDDKRKKEIEYILSKKLPREEENKEIEKIKGYKDFNETGLHDIDLNDCIIQNKKKVFYQLKEFFNNR